jgi:hypothetical protein
MPAHHDDELPTIDASDLAQVTGGTGDDMSSMMMPMMMMMRNRSQAPAPAPVAPPPWKPKIMVDGFEQQPTSSGNGTFTSEV